MTNILFDLDGTLTDPHEGITQSIHYALDELGVTAPENLRWCIGPPLRESFRSLLAVYPDKNAEDAISFYRKRFLAKGMYENRVYDGIVDMLNTLKKSGHTLFVATTKPWVYAKKIIEHFELRSFFKEIYGSELDGTRTNKGDLIRFILDIEEIAPEEAIMVGDRKHDLAGAKANDVKSVAVTWGYGTLRELQEESPDKICNNPAELTQYLLKN